MGLLVSELGEFGLINRLRELDVVRGIGDDCAVLTPPPGHDLVMTADALIEGVHFRHDWIKWKGIGWRSMAVNISDVIAMGARPAGILVTLGLKRETTVEDIEAFYAGAAEMLEATRKAAGAEVYIIGGDIVASPTATAISVTAFGYVEHGKSILRSGAQPGDVLCVEGPLGHSAAGLWLYKTADDGRKYLPSRAAQEFYEWFVQPWPRVSTSRIVAPTGLIHAMTDVSDGISGDSRNIADESQVRIIIEETRLPTDHLYFEHAKGIYDWDYNLVLDMVLHGGEDYALLMCTAPQSVGVLNAAVQKEFEWVKDQIKPIGRVTEGAGVWLERLDGTLVPLARRSFQHF